MSRALTTSLRAPRGPGGGGAVPHSSSAWLETSALFPLQMEPWRAIAAGTDAGVCGPPPGLPGLPPRPLRGARPLQHVSTTPSHSSPVGAVAKG